jgi:hypothetical protein
MKDRVSQGAAAAAHSLWAQVPSQIEDDAGEASPKNDSSNNTVSVSNNTVSVRTRPMEIESQTDLKWHGSLDEREDLQRHAKRSKRIDNVQEQQVRLILRSVRVSQAAAAAQRLWSQLPPQRLTEDDAGDLTKSKHVPGNNIALNSKSSKEQVRASCVRTTLDCAFPHAH